jgi:TolA-binding protein
MKANRALFKKYLNTKSQGEKHLIEKQFVSDDFTMDAFEGYLQHKDAWQTFEALDQKYNRKQRKKKLAYFGSALTVSLLLGWYLIPAMPLKQTTSAAKQKAESIQIKIHRKDDIQQMKTAALSERITPTEVRLNFSPSNEAPATKAEVLERMQQMPTQSVEIRQQKPQVLQVKMGRELLIKNFKVLDYRYYRKGDLTQTFEENEHGEQQLKIPYINILNKAIEHFARQDYKLALLLFDEILLTYPDDANALFYGAMCLYNLSEYNQAESRFVKLQNVPFGNFSEEANWYLLHVYQKTKKEAAFSSLQKMIIGQKGFYAEKAENLSFH